MEAIFKLSSAAEPRGCVLGWAERQLFRMDVMEFRTRRWQCFVRQETGLIRRHLRRHNSAVEQVGGVGLGKDGAEVVMRPLSLD